MMVNEWYTAAMVLQGMMKRQRQHVESIDALAAWLGISVRLTKLHCKRYQGTNSKSCQTLDSGL
jgi:hypothetical protein